MKIYLASYLPCIYEGNWGTISVHKTRKGAEVAVEFHKSEQKKEYDILQNHAIKSGFPLNSKFGDSEKWNVFQMELNE